MASQVAGVSSLKGAVIPLSVRLAVMASRMAKKTEAAKKKGGSPTAWGEGRGRERGERERGWREERGRRERRGREEGGGRREGEGRERGRKGVSKTVEWMREHTAEGERGLTLEEKMARGLVVLSISVTFSSTGMSEQEGIL